jgi:hypothetical protein
MLAYLGIGCLIFGVCSFNLLFVVLGIALLAMAE